MKKLILASIVSFPLMFTAMSGAAIAGDAAAGKAKSAACGGCHGFDGNSPISAYPKLAGQNEAYIVKQVKDFKANTDRQNPIMMGMVAALSDADAADIGAYFQAQTLKEAATFDAEKATAGREIYKGGDLQKGIPACQACHGPTGAGTAGIGYPQIGGQYVEYTLAQLNAFKNGTRKNDDKKLMRSIVEKMSDAEITAVANYIASLK
ncbi:Cytochrome c4 [hydrothermal vent metagenome]|uniref:Cytochrome c4 n=1 Tax=hydrothermal vent metagenome TaxID=652676 RepID=A0A3B0WFS8_9ZZZZ